MYDLCLYALNCGIAMAARIPMIAMTIINSINVKPFSFFLFILINILSPPYNYECMFLTAIFKYDLKLKKALPSPPPTSIVIMLQKVLTNSMPSQRKEAMNKINTLFTTGYRRFFERRSQSHSILPPIFHGS